MALTAEDLARIKEIAEAANQPILLQLADGRKRFEALEEKVKKHGQVLEGNGSPGLIKDVFLLKQKDNFGMKILFIFLTSGTGLGLLGLAYGALYIARNIK
jgi:hypothetical protein